MSDKFRIHKKVEVQVKKDKKINIYKGCKWNI